MPKAILELLEMPESCETCPIKRYLHYGWVEYICGITGEEIANKGRRSDCPLKLVEDLESTYKGGNTPTEYHNPADVEALRKAREALITTIKGIDNKKIIPANADAAIELWRHKQQISNALAAIDKAIGGGDVDKG